jgi:histidyl-tRNA synthetase
MTKIQPIRGTRDYFGEDSNQFEFIIALASEISAKYGFEVLHSPIFEATEVFKRAVGEETDIVTKEMYSFDTKGGENITLRPEFTAGVVRALISNSLQQNLPQKFFSYGPVFRYERPQKGRQRQFHQINFEYFGNSKPIADAEMIILASEILQQIGITENIELNVNSLGDKESRANYLNALVEYLTKYEAELSEESKIRLHKNPLRILDSKSDADKKIIATAPKILTYFTKEAKEFFDDFLNLISGTVKIPFKVNPEIVRGLDYYNHTVFEFISNDAEIGSQSTILAGGRYDGLVEQMGGGQVPAIGFAAGIERLMLVSKTRCNKAEKYVVISDDDKKSLDIATNLRKKGKVCEIAIGNNFKKKLEKANKSGADFVIFDFSEGLQIKNMQTGEQTEFLL